MKRLYILPYKMGSKSARDLARTVGCLRLTPTSTTYRNKPHHVIVNWGGTAQPRWDRGQSVILNHPSRVAITANKLLAFRKYRQMPVPVESFDMPESTENFSIAKNWIEQGHTVYCRTVLQGHSGRGIIVARTVDELVPAHLYTKQFKARWEYRVHIFRGRVIDEVKKGRRRDVTLDDLGRDIRNHENGYIFIRNNIEVPQEVRDAALCAVGFYGLDFGAVDVGWHPERGACVYEINTSPGIEGTSLQRYAQALRGLC